MKRFLVLCVAVIACYAAVTGSIAYFTDSVETTNRLASGNLHVVQHEYERGTNDNGTTVQAFTQAKQLYPAVKTTGEAAEKVTMPNGVEVDLTADIRNYVDKIVTAENKGSLNMYVRTYIAVPSFSADVATEPWITLDVNTQQYDTDSWSALEDAVLSHVEIDEHYYDIYMTTYSGAIEPNGITPPGLLGFYMDSKVTNDGEGLIFKDEENNVTYNLGNGSNMKILVATVASQASVFNNVGEAMAATYPKDEDGKETYHPWDNTFFVTTQDELNTALYTAQSEYDTVISFAIATEGNYTIPSQLPAGLRITGAGAEVRLMIEDDNNALSANDVEFDHVTFDNAFTFTGWGSFEEVTFADGTTINATHDTVLVDCENLPTWTGNVSIVTSVPTPTPATSSATTP